MTIYRIQKALVVDGQLIQLVQSLMWYKGRKDKDHFFLSLCSSQAQWTVKDQIQKQPEVNCWSQMQANLFLMQFWSSVYFKLHFPLSHSIPFFSYIFSPKVHPRDALTSHWAGEGHGFGFQPLRADFIYLFFWVLKMSGEGFLNSVFYIEITWQCH